MSNFSNKRSSNITSFIALVLGILLIVSVVLGCGTYFGGWFSKSEDSTTEDTTADGETNNLVVSETDTGSGISIMKSVISSSNELGATTYSGSVEIDGSTYSYESSYDITATIDDEATDRTVNWTLSCSSISDISSYVVLSSDTSESGESITVYCLQPFSYQITLTATSGSVSATCSLDYVRRANGFYLKQAVYGEYDDGESSQFITDNYYIAYSDSTYTWLAKDYLCEPYDSSLSARSGSTITCGLDYGTGSISGDYSYGYIFLSLAPDVESSILNALGCEEFYYSINSNMTGFTMTDVFNTVFEEEGNWGTSNAMSNSSTKLQVYNVFKSYYDSKTPVFEITVRAISGVVSSIIDLSTTVLFDPSAYYVSATSINTSSTSLYF